MNIIDIARECKAAGVPVLVPIIEPMDPRRCNVYEHTPLSYYRYGEYPRFIRPPGAYQPQVKVCWSIAAIRNSDAAPVGEG